VKGIAAQPDVTAINKAGKIKKRENLISSLLLLEPVVNNENSGKIAGAGAVRVLTTGS